ncbi:MAG: hypothetical protein ACOYMG_10235, partial [Candidatus Methylumidiphilus sp.]
MNTPSRFEEYPVALRNTPSRFGYFNPSANFRAMSGPTPDGIFYPVRNVSCHVRRGEPYTKRLGRDYKHCDGVNTPSRFGDYRQNSANAGRDILSRPQRFVSCQA